jgi:hypothetical protein
MISISIHRLQRVACFGYRVYEIGTMEGRVFLVANSCHSVTQKKGAVTCTKDFFMVKRPKAAILEGESVELPISRP